MTRPSVTALDEILGHEFLVLDHGFVRVIDYMGDDAAIVQAARVSYGDGTKHVQDDTALIRYLMRHRHTSPFEMCEIKLHVKLPIFVARQWIRHRTASVNEYSARYSIVEEEFYIPDCGNIRMQSSTNKQGGGECAPFSSAMGFVSQLRHESKSAFQVYDSNCDIGISRETARLVLPVNSYTQWYWKIDLHNLMHFLTLRSDPHAQYEIRAYAEVIATILERWVPITCQAWKDYRRDAVSLSAGSIRALKRVLSGEAAGDVHEDGVAAREWREVRAAMGI